MYSIPLKTLFDVQCSFVSLSLPLSSLSPPSLPSVPPPPSLPPSLPSVPPPPSLPSVPPPPSLPSVPPPPSLHPSIFASCLILHSLNVYEWVYVCLTCTCTHLLYTFSLSLYFREESSQLVRCQSLRVHLQSLSLT